MPKYLQFIKARWFLFVTGLTIGLVAVLAVRFITYDPQMTHYHANFAVYINGEQQKFVGVKYYEETAAMACTIAEVDDPKERAHMHDNIYDVVHVEDKLVTWGNFLQNLSWGLGDDYLKTDTGVLTVDDQHKLTFVVNGKTVESLYGLIINDEDRVLISYGSEDTDQIKKQYDTIPSNAHEYNVKPDPASCSGSHQTTLEDRFNHLF